MTVGPAGQKPTRWDWLFVAVLALLVPAMGALVVLRSAFLQARHTDFDVYARAGWAIRSGHDIYAVTNDRGLHYCYPPPFAYAMTPFAEPPHGSAGYLPFAASVAIWYCLSVAALLIAVHLLAAALEAGNPVEARRWWRLRVAPVLFTLPAIGDTLSHGQVNTLVLLLVCCMIAAALRRQSVRAGLWLGGAVALKVIPGFLILTAVRRRDLRWVVATAACAAALCWGLPALVIGPRAATRQNLAFVDAMVRPAIGDAADSERGPEMFHVLRTDNQSIQAFLHAWQHWPDPDAPPQPGPTTLTAHWLLGGLMTGLTLLAARGRRLAGNDLALFVSLLTAVTLYVSPMCHLHYYCLALPLIMSLIHREWCERGSPTAGVTFSLLLALHVVGAAFPLLFERYRNLGVTPLTTLPLWAAGVRVLWKQRFADRSIQPFRRSALRREAA